MSILAQDTFTRSNQSGWGTGSDGSSWSVVTGTATYSIASNEGHATGQTGNQLSSYGTLSVADCILSMRFKVSATSNNVTLNARGSGSNTGYRLKVQSGTLFLNKDVSGTITTLQSTAIAMSANTYYWIKLYVVGTTIQGKFWTDGASEPTSWTLTATDSSITAAGNVGIFFSLNTTADTIDVDHFLVTDANGIPSSHVFLSDGLCGVFS